MCKIFPKIGQHPRHPHLQKDINYIKGGASQKAQKNSTNNSGKLMVYIFNFNVTLFLYKDDKMRQCWR